MASATTLRYPNPMARVDYDHNQHRVYHAGRRHPDATMEQWRRVLRDHAGSPPPRKWLDIGSGTGRFTTILADLFDAEVLGIEPSAGMRSEAERHSTHPGVSYVEGNAEAVPVDDATFDAAFISMVHHHLADPENAAKEIHRVLRPGGRLLIRTATIDSHLDGTFYRIFESARRVDEARLPTLTDLRAFGRAAGLVEVHHEVVRQVTDKSLVVFRERMESRPFSTFDLMAESEIEAGFKMFEQAIEDEGERPAIEFVDLMVLEKAHD